eukprot:312397-Chlamydomonas_euryale.AAC.1
MPLRRLVVAALRCCPAGSPAGRNASCMNSWWRWACAAVWLAVRFSAVSSCPFPGLCAFLSFLHLAVVEVGYERVDPV